MKTDSQLRQDVTDELAFQPNINEAEIGVAVKDGVVTLSGTVGSFVQKRAAELCAERVNGVRALADDLEVKLPHSLARSDTDIARAVASALEWDVEVPDAVKARVENGWVFLDVARGGSEDGCRTAVRRLAYAVSPTSSVTPARRSELDEHEDPAALAARPTWSRSDHGGDERGRVTLRGKVRRGPSVRRRARPGRRRCHGSRGSYRDRV